MFVGSTDFPSERIKRIGKRIKTSPIEVISHGKYSGITGSRDKTDHDVMKKFFKCISKASSH